MTLNQHRRGRRRSAAAQPSNPQSDAKLSTGGNGGGCSGSRGRRDGRLISQLLDVENGADGARDCALGKIRRELDSELLRFGFPEQSPQERNDLHAWRQVGTHETLASSIKTKTKTKNDNFALWMKNISLAVLLMKRLHKPAHSFND